MLVIGAVIRHFYNSRHKGLPSPWWTWGVAAAGMVAIVLLSMAGPAGVERGGGGARRAGDLRPGRGGRARALQHVPHGRARLGGDRRCRPRASCSTRPSASVQHADEIQLQAVLTHAMPPGNITEITPEERQVLAAWLADGAKAE